MLGRQWKEESEEVKSTYKSRAEHIKHQHAMNNPGYQYAPRKPGDKKRRMTKKKLARMRSADSTNDVADMNRSDADTDLPSDLESENDMPKSSAFAGLLTAEDHLGTRRSPRVSHLNVNDDGNIEITLPSNNINIFREVQDYQNQHGTYVTAPFTSGSASQVITSTPQHVQNDDAFVNSLIDWEGIAADAALIRDATPKELAELAELELGNPFLDFSAENTRAAFNEELDRTMGFF